MRLLADLRATWTIASIMKVAAGLGLEELVETRETSAWRKCLGVNEMRL